MTPNAADYAALEADPFDWLLTLYPDEFTAPFAAHHLAFWRWVWSIHADQRPRPYVGIWSREGAKSSSVETALIALGARGVRRYGVICSETQDQADEHVLSVAARLEASTVARWYPDMADRAVNKYGHSKGWRRNRLHTRSGFILDALGLDVASRGLKVEDARPDIICLDDCDSDTDDPGATEKKERKIARRVLPLGTARTAVIAIQNLIIDTGIFARLATGETDILADRILSGPIPALEGFEYAERADAQEGESRYVITAGEPTWAGQGVAECQAYIDTYGISAFRSECQHDTEAPAGGMFDHLTYGHIGPDEVPELDLVACWVDPAVTDKDTSDSHAIQIDGRARSGAIYRLWSWEQRSSPLASLSKAIIKACEYHAAYVGIETDQGGDTWQSVWREAKKAAAGERPDLSEQIEVLRMRSEKAGAGHGAKAHRASLMLADYERAGRIFHVDGTHHILEAALRRFPRTKPFDLVDAAYWGWWDLRRITPAVLSRPRGRLPVAAR